MNKIAIIGAGASGLMCAIICAKASLKVEIFEQNDKCAKKILVSGNGRCNISNKNLSSNDYFSNNPSFVAFALNSFGFKDFEEFTTSIGLLLNVKEDGRAYPQSNEAKSVAMLLVEYAKNLGVIFHTNTKVLDIEYNNLFSLITQKTIYTNFHSVVVATGSQAASHLGGCDDGYIFAKKFSHNIIPPYPSLVQLHLNSNIHSKMSGTKIEGEVTLLINHKQDMITKGDILFTSYGVSGFAILDISQRASVALMNYENVDLSINLLPNFSSQKLSSHIIKLSALHKEFTLLDILIGILPIKIANTLLTSIDISPKLLAKNVNTKLSKKIANSIVNWRFEVVNTHGFRHAEVSGGGVDTNEINSKTMESLKQKNLYFCGEVVDVLGRRGGFNFAYAWASGHLCASKILRSL